MEKSFRKVTATPEPQHVRAAKRPASSLGSLPIPDNTDMHCRSIGVWRRQRPNTVQQGVQVDSSTTRLCRMRSFAKIYRVTFLTPLNLTAVTTGPLITIATPIDSRENKMIHRVWRTRKRDSEISAAWLAWQLPATQPKDLSINARPAESARPAQPRKEP